MNVVDALLKSGEPSVRWKVRTQVLDEPADSPAIRRLRNEIRRSPRVRRLLDRELPPRAYDKWQGSHWVLATLADLGYPPGSAELVPLRDHVVDTWLHPYYYREFDAGTKASSYRQQAVPRVAGRYRRCGSQQGNALLSVIRLGLADERADALAERLVHWQWPDGGWNCDRNPSADTSSFHETLLPMRGLARHGSDESVAAARRAAEVFLTRRLIFRRSTGTLISTDFVRLRYPSYWHYDVLGGLKGMVDAGLIHDERCTDALDLLASKRLPGGGCPAQKRLYRGESKAGPRDVVDWGGVDTKRMNEWVTADALAVLHAAGRL